MSSPVLRHPLQTPLGTFTLVGDERGLSAIHFPGRLASEVAALRESSRHPALRVAAAQLSEYFEGRRRSFTLRLAPEGTGFQRSVWRALEEIPFGETRSYSEIAHRIGRPTATRAVGAANGRNPLPIVVPCHRVIGADGSMTGFAGGLRLKRWLLAHEAGQSQLQVA